MAKWPPQQRLQRSLSSALLMSQPPNSPAQGSFPPPFPPQAPPAPLPPAAPGGSATVSATSTTPPPQPAPYAPTTVISLPTPAAGAVSTWAAAAGLVLGFIAAGFACYWLRRVTLAVRNAPRDRRPESRRSSRAPSRASSLESLHSLPESTKSGRSRSSARIQLSAPFSSPARDEEAAPAETGATPFGWLAWVAALFQPHQAAAPTAAATATPLSIGAASESSSGASRGVHRGKL